MVRYPQQITGAGNKSWFKDRSDSRDGTRTHGKRAYRVTITGKRRGGAHDVASGRKTGISGKGLPRRRCTLFGRLYGQSHTRRHSRSARRQIGLAAWPPSTGTCVISLRYLYRKALRQRDDWPDFGPNNKPRPQRYIQRGACDVKLGLYLYIVCLSAEKLQSWL